MKIIIHIGHHNTGTIALQTGLASHWYELFDYGCLAPILDVKNQVRALSCRVHDTENKPLHITGFCAAQDAIAQEMQLDLDAPQFALSALREQIKMFEPETLILCSAHFSDLSGPFFSRLDRHLWQILSSGDVHLHAYLRRPDHHLEQLIGQQIHQGTPLPDARNYLHSLQGGPHMDYNMMLHPWVTAFPNATLHLERYEDTPSSFDLWQAFCLRFSLPTKTECLSVSHAQSQQAPRATWQALGYANSVTTPKTVQTIHQKILKCLNNLDLPDDQYIELLDSQTRMHLHASLRDIAADLDRNLTGQPFAQDADAILQPRETRIDTLAATLASSIARVPLRLLQADLRHVYRMLRSKIL